MVFHIFRCIYIHVTNSIPKAFGFGIFTGFMFPFFAKSDRSGLDFVPGQGHRSGLIGAKKVHILYKKDFGHRLNNGNLYTINR